MPGSPQRSAALKQCFLEHYAVTGTVEGAASLAGIDSRMHRKWLAQSEHYRERFQRACDQATDTLLAEARRRSLGYEEPVYFQGRQVGATRRYSDILLIFLLKGARPETFRDNYNQHLHLTDQSSHVTVNVVHEYREASPITLDVPPPAPELPPINYAISPDEPDA